MKKYWSSYHGADGQCWFENQYCKSTGLIVLGNPSVFRVSEISFYPNKLSQFSLHSYLFRTFQEFSECTIQLKLPIEVMAIANSLAADGKILFSNTENNIINLVSVSNPSNITATNHENPRKWWQFWK